MQGGRHVMGFFSLGQSFLVGIADIFGLPCHRCRCATSPCPVQVRPHPVQALPLAIVQLFPKRGQIVLDPIDLFAVVFPLHQQSVATKEQIRIVAVSGVNGWPKRSHCINSRL